MLSGETAKGKYPGECVRMMHEICLEAEGTLHFRNFFGQIVGINKQKHTNETLAAAAVQAAFEQEAAALIVLTVSGNTARLVAKYRPQVRHPSKDTRDDFCLGLHEVDRPVFSGFFFRNAHGLCCVLSCVHRVCLV
jgi:pyruvate kinase